MNIYVNCMYLYLAFLTNQLIPAVFLSMLLVIFFSFKLGFTQCKAEQPLQGIELQEKNNNTYRKDHISTMSQGFKRSSNNPAYPFL